MAISAPLTFHPRTGDSRLAMRLKRETECEVLFDAASRGRYATDASIYQIEPVGVVVPKGERDAQIAMQIALDHEKEKIALGHMDDAGGNGERVAYLYDRRAGVIQVRAAGGERNHHGDRLRGKALRLCATDRDQHCYCGQRHPFHLRPHFSAAVIAL